MSIVVVPVLPAPNWSPALDPIAVGETARCGLDARLWAARRGLTVLSVAVATDPTLSLAEPPSMIDDVFVFDLVAGSGATPGMDLPVVFTLAFAEDNALKKVIQARQPVRAGPATGLSTPASAVLSSTLADETGYLTDGGGVLIIND